MERFKVSETIYYFLFIFVTNELNVSHLHCFVVIVNPESLTIVIFILKFSNMFFLISFSCQLNLHSPGKRDSSTEEVSRPD